VLIRGPGQISIRQPLDIKHTVSPLSFVCNTCKRISTFSELKNYNLRKGRCKHCSGILQQTAHIFVHPDCGKIEEIRSKDCPQCNTEMILNKISYADLRTWQYKCPTCGLSEQLESFCNDCYTQARNVDPSVNYHDYRMRLKPCTSNSVVVPQSSTIPSFPELGSDVEPELLLAEYLGLLRERGLTLEQAIDKKDQVADLDNVTETLIREMRAQGISEDKISRVVEGARRESGVEAVKDAVRGLFEGQNLDALKQRVFDYSGIASNPSRLKSLEEIGSSLSEKELEQTRRTYDHCGVAEAKLVTGVQLVTCVYGFMVGSSDPDVGFFRPFRDPLGFTAYAISSESEGILIRLDRRRTAAWVSRQASSKAPFEVDEDSSLETKKLYLEMEPGTEPFVLVKELLHTMSHALIRNANLLCGIGADSLGELIYPNVPAVLIYSSSASNLGGIATMFESGMWKWFAAAEDSISNCTYDPICLSEKGACHACMHLPEYVCTEWNAALDRSRLIGNDRRGMTGFWANGTD